MINYLNLLYNFLIIMKQIFKIIYFIWLFYFSLINVLAFDANLSLNQSEIDINDFVNLRIQISSSQWWQVLVTEIKGLEKFKKIGQSQSTSSSSKIMIVNWQTKSETITTINLDLNLEAEETWEFEIGPAVLQNWTWSINTNSVKLKVIWNKIQGIWINNSVLPSQKINNSNSSKIEKPIKKLEENPIKIDELENNNYELYLFVLILLVTLIIFYFLLKNRKQSLLKNNDSLAVWVKPNFEEIKKHKIVYPEIDDNDFIKKAEIVLRKKLQNKFDLKNIENLTFQEIQTLLWKKEDLKDLFDLINKWKYWDTINNNSEILEKIRNI